jgi:hypothetical protein
VSFRPGAAGQGCGQCQQGNISARLGLNESGKVAIQVAENAAADQLA